ncbi:MAG: prolipoprotein diacylglyceryl transferase family protein [Solirubrobacteraceae bacterium]
MQPELDLFGLPIKTFGLSFGLSFVICGMVLSRRLRELGKPVDYAYEIVFSALVGGLIGARLWYVAEHTDALSEDFFGTLFGGSGLTWYGGALGGAAAVLLWAKRKDMFGLGLLDLAAPALALGYAGGRVGCQLSGDGDYGEAWDGPWAMAYPDGVVPTDEAVHPTPVYETLAMGVTALVLWHLRDRFAPGRLFALYLVLAGLERFLVEFVRRNSPALAGLTTAQLVSLVMLAAGAIWLARTGGGVTRTNSIN